MKRLIFLDNRNKKIQTEITLEKVKKDFSFIKTNINLIYEILINKKNQIYILGKKGEILEVA